MVNVAELERLCEPGGLCPFTSIQTRVRRLRREPQTLEVRFTGTKAHLPCPQSQADSPLTLLHGSHPSTHLLHSAPPEW